MEDCIMFKNIFVTLMFLVSSVFANTLGLLDNGNGSWNVTYTSNDTFAGFQFNIDGATISDAYGGDAASAGMVYSTQDLKY